MDMSSRSNPEQTGMGNVQERIKKLTEQLVRYNKNYYEEDAPVISDREYDEMLKELKSLEDSYPALKMKNSPTEHVGGKVSGKFEKVNHRVPVISLDNSYDQNELLSFDNRVKKRAASSGDMKYCSRRGIGRQGLRPGRILVEHVEAHQRDKAHGKAHGGHVERDERNVHVLLHGEETNGHVGQNGRKERGVDEDEKHAVLGVTIGVRCRCPWH